VKNIRISKINYEVAHKKRVEPFLKWAGGKSQLLEQFKPLFPKEGTYERYAEPFLGGGAVFFYLEPKEAVLSDLNKDLIGAYRVVKNNIKELLKILDKYQKNHSKEFYLKIREEYNTGNLDSVKNAAHLIYLNKTCFNGLYRVNKNGNFNVPFGQHNSFSFNKESLLLVSRLLKNTKLKNESFEKVLNYARKGDFFYLDPPYYPLNLTSNFTTYTNSDFLELEQETLAKVFEKLDKIGCKVMLSNSDTPFIRNLYKKWDIKKVVTKRYINCIGEKRGNVAEVVVRNYK